MVDSVHCLFDLKWKWMSFGVYRYDFIVCVHRCNRFISMAGCVYSIKGKLLFSHRSHLIVQEGALPITFCYNGSLVYKITFH